MAFDAFILFFFPTVIPFCCVGEKVEVIMCTVLRVRVDNNVLHKVYMKMVRPEPGKCVYYFITRLRLFPVAT